MKIEIYAEFAFKLPLTKDQVDALIVLAEHHYDARCRMAATGFLAGWRNQIEASIKCELPPGTVTAGHDELDTCLKLLEMRFAAKNLVSRAITDGLNRHFLGVIRLANRMEWHVFYEGDDG